MKKIGEFLKKEIVLSVALLLAILSMFIVLPDKEYVGYIDFRTLSILFCLMAVMVGMQEIGVFRFTAEKLLVKVKNTIQLVLILVLLCFFFSMFMTNDVALITFVPFTFIVLQMLGEDIEKRLMIPVVVFQTIAANLGSMLTPMGNPQNLYLYGKSGMGLGSFLGLMLPYTLFSLVLLIFCGVWLGKKSSDGTVEVVLKEKTSLKGREKELLRYSVLFVLSLLTVAHVLDYRMCLVIVLAAFLILDRPLLKRVDYGLLLTFIGFFVFIGNMGRVPFFNDLLQK
ncbi:MAG: anion permease, partial [Lachnospiraceae bacterium]|nr:anion permease [Lachnospiraceae bacterium]